MAKNQVDYNTVDKITVTTKFDKEDNVIADYALFGWQLFDREEDKIYFDAVHLTFVRKHKIKNKDQLQLLQVYYEDYFNQLSDCQTHKHRKSKSLALTFSLLLFAIFAASVYMVIFASLELKILFSIVIAVCLVFGGFVIKISRRIRKKETDICLKKSSLLEDEIDKILAQCKLLVGGNDEKED